MPAFNEASIVEPHLHELVAYLDAFHPEGAYELIVVDDGSWDDTPALADAFAASHPAVRVYHHSSNRGLGAALQTGFAQARGDVVVTLDLDLSYTPACIAALLQALAVDQADIAVASPYSAGGSVRNVPWMRKQMSAWANRFLSAATAGAVVTLTGMVRAYDARAVRALRVHAQGMEFNHVILLAALRRGMRVTEVPAQLCWRDAPGLPTERVDGTPPPRRSSMRILGHIWCVLASGFRHRPAMVLTLPGLIPGLLPCVLALLVLLRPSRSVVVDTTAITITVQCVSLAFLAVLTGSYVRQVRSLARRAPLADRRSESHA
ncbi:MAG: glycosyltransferase family 2 protein [Candidatus Eremiobacteraeota bacterium]|nr:glycosyltransferase family 2 protein [Candidatus Eremiobacteraeota bacterium]